MAIVGGKYNDVLNGDELNNTFIGLGGNDKMYGKGGNDTFNENGDNGKGNDLIHGGDGFDLLLYDKVDNPVELNTLTGKIQNGSRNDTFISIEHFALSQYNDVVIGGREDLHFELGFGDDAFSNIAQGNKVDGGWGTDLLDMHGASTSLKIDLDKEIVKFGSLWTVQLIDFEEVIGASGRRNVLLGNSEDNLLIGGNKNDNLNGRDGADTLEGGKGADTIKGGEGKDIIYGGSGWDTLTDMSGDDDFIDGGGGNDTITFQTGTVIGGDGNDLIVQKQDYPTAVTTTINSGDGDDRIVLNTINVFVRTEDGDDHVELIRDFHDDLGNYYGNIKTGGGNDTVYLQGGFDIIKMVVNGGSGEDEITVSGDGNPILRIYDSGAKFDRSEGAIVGFERVDIDNVTAYIYSNGTEIIGSSSAEYTIIFSDEVDITLYGGDDYVDLHGNHASVKTGAGSDKVETYFSQGEVVENAIVETGGGDDTIRINGHTTNSYFNLGSGDDVVYLVRSIGNVGDLGAGNDEAWIYGSGNTVYGQRGADWFEIDGFDHQISGGNGDDIFIYRADSSQLTKSSDLSGGNGADVFVFDLEGSQAATITDFDPTEDKLSFTHYRAGINSDRMIVEQVGDDVLLTFQNSDPAESTTEILLLDVDASEIEAADIFVNM